MAIKKTSKPDNKIEVVSLEQFRPDENNANKGTERGLRILDDSLRELGAGRSILVDKHGVILAGNKTQERAVDIGLTDAIVVHTNGTQLVVVQRDDLDATEPAGRRMGLLDNRSSELGLDWNTEVLAGMLEKDPAALKGLFEDRELDKLLEAAGGGVERCEYPIVAEAGEKYNYVMIFATNEMDWAWLQSVLDMRVEQDYKSTGVGLSHVMTVGRFAEVWKSRLLSPVTEEPTE